MGTMSSIRFSVLISVHLNSLRSSCHGHLGSARIEGAQDCQSRDNVALKDW